VIALKICLPPLPGGTGRGRLLPTPDTGVSPNGHGRRGGRPGNGHESGSSLDAVARTLTRAAGQASAARDDAGFAVRWGEYEPAIRRWEQITGQPAPPPADPGPGGRPVLNPGFCEWLMGLPEGWVCAIPGLSRTVRLRILGNGVVPRQGAAALRLLIGTATVHPASRSRPVPAAITRGPPPEPPRTRPGPRRRTPGTPGTPALPPRGACARHSPTGRGPRTALPSRLARQRQGRDPEAPGLAAECRQQRYLRPIPLDERNHP
jgi:hypothetical protein